MLGGTVTIVYWLQCQHINSTGLPTELVENGKMFGQGDFLEMHLQQNPAALWCVVTSMKLDEFINWSELFVLLLALLSVPIKKCSFI